MIKLIQILVLIVCPVFAIAQKVISEEEASSFALKNNAMLKVAELEVLQKTQLRKTAFNIDNPEVLMQSPTGQFQTIGVLQSMRFPTVYIKQNQLLSEQISVSQINEKATRNSILLQAKSLYLNHQYATTVLNFYLKMDSIYSRIKESTDREFLTGTIDYLEKTLSDSKQSEIKNKLTQAKLDLQITTIQLQTFMGFSEDFISLPMTKYRLVETSLISKLDSATIQKIPSIQFYKAQEKISLKTLELERNKALPGLTFGFLNQANKNTSTTMRLQFGITLPIWFWQYKGAIQASKTSVEIAKQNSTNQERMLAMEIDQSVGNSLKFLEAINYFETIGLKQSNEIISVSKRFFEAGKNFNYTNYLRTVSDAYSIELQYIETIKNYNQSILNINYLKGNL